MVPKRKTSSIDAVSLMGFSDELQKIASMIFSATTSKDVQKRRALTSMPKLTSKPNAAPPPPSSDPLSSTRSTPPPPVTSG
jgi:hypothetical protein